MSLTLAAALVRPPRLDPTAELLATAAGRRGMVVAQLTGPAVCWRPANGRSADRIGGVARG